MEAVTSVTPKSRVVLPQKAAKLISLSNRQLVYALVIAIVILTVATRLFALGRPNFWYDEMASIRYAFDLSVFDVHPPFYYAILNVLMNFNQSEFILRLPSAIAGILTVIFVYLTGKQLFGLKTTLVAMLLASISPLMVWHSQEARMYSQALLFALMSVYFYVLILKKGSRFAWFGYILSAVLAIYSHLYAGLVLLTLSLHLILFHRKLLVRWIGVNLIIGLSYAPWIIILASLPGKQIGTGRSFSILHLFYNYYAFTTGYSLGPTINELRTPELSVLVPHLPLIAPLGIVIAILVIAGIYYQWRADREKAALIILWAFLPVLIAVFIPLLRKSMIFNVRYVLVALPAYILLLALGVKSLGQHLGTIALIILITYSGLSLYNHYFNPHYTKEDVRSAAHYIAQQSKPDDHILVTTVGSLFNWYFHSNNPVIANNQGKPANELVADAAENTNTLWFVESRPWQTDPDGDIKAYLNSNYQLIDEQDFPGVQIYRYCVTNCES